MILSPRAVHTALCYWVSSYAIAFLFLVALWGILTAVFATLAPASPPVQYNDALRRYEPAYPSVINAARHAHRLPLEH